MKALDIIAIFISLPSLTQTDTGLSELSLIWTRLHIEEVNHMDLKTISEAIRSLDKLFTWLIVLLNMYPSLLAWTYLSSSGHWTQNFSSIPQMGKCRGSMGSPEIPQLIYPKITSDILIFTSLLLILGILMFLLYLQNISSYGNTLSK